MGKAGTMQEMKEVLEVEAEVRCELGLIRLPAQTQNVLFYFKLSVSVDQRLTDTGFLYSRTIFFFPF